MNLLWRPTSKALGRQKYNENTTASPCHNNNDSAKRWVLSLVKTRPHHRDEIPERDVTYHFTCLLIYHWTTTHSAWSESVQATGSMVPVVNPTFVSAVDDRASKLTQYNVYQNYRNRSTLLPLSGEPFPHRVPLETQNSSKCTIFDTPLYKMCRVGVPGTPTILRGPSLLQHPRIVIVLRAYMWPPEGAQWGPMWKFGPLWGPNFRGYPQCERCFQ